MSQNHVCPQQSYNTNPFGYNYNVCPYNYTVNQPKRENKKNIRKRKIAQIIFDIIGIFITFLLFGLIYRYVPPRIQFATCDMSDIVFPNLLDTIPFWAVGIYCSIFPVVVFIFVELYNSRLFWFQSKECLSLRERIQKFLVLFNHAFTLFAFGAGITLLLTEIGKRAVGRLRPHFLAVCAPNVATINCITNGATGSIFNSFTTGGTFCTGSANSVEEARLSFPSGHSSFSTFTMIFLIIYLEARFVSISTRFIKALLQIGAFFVAGYTSLSRVPDYAHRLSDVFAGMILGALVAYVMLFIIGKILWVFEKITPSYKLEDEINTRK